MCMRNMLQNNRTFLSILALSLALASTVSTESINLVEPCEEPEPPTPCYSADTSPTCMYCLGIETIAGNPSVYPLSCNGDLVLTIAGCYWNAQEDGLEYALFNTVNAPNSTTLDSRELNNLYRSDFLKPSNHWDWGYKLGLGYNSPRDGWDIQGIWTHFKNHMSSCDSATPSDDNFSLLPLWSAFSTNAGQAATSNVLYATRINTEWNLKLDLIDLEVGRAFWNSKYLTIRPHMGLRLGYVRQDYEIDYSGGAWGAVGANSAAISEVRLKNHFDGTGVRAGLDTDWYVGHGFSLFGNGAISIVYGHFSIGHDEYLRQTQSPFGKSPVHTTTENFHTSKAMTDLELGFEWKTMFNNCRYGFSIALAWEQHLFFNQNNLWRVNRMDGVAGSSSPNSSGENIFIQRKGDLSTQGWTVSAIFDF